MNTWPPGDNLKDYLTNCTYLEDSSLDIYGYKLYGSPWTPTYGVGWGFNLNLFSVKWDSIPRDTDILITHGPALGCRDICMNGDRSGCENLLTTIVEEVKPIYHIFGHIHEGNTKTERKRRQFLHFLEMKYDGNFKCVTSTEKGRKERRRNKPFN
jgi:hypothetical protein